VQAMLQPLRRVITPANQVLRCIVILAYQPLLSGERILELFSMYWQASVWVYQALRRTGFQHFHGHLKIKDMRDASAKMLAERSLQQVGLHLVARKVVQNETMSAIRHSQSSHDRLNLLAITSFSHASINAPQHNAAYDVRQALPVCQSIP
jgi:hypothetical protein